jgi:hypothetical protein
VQTISATSWADVDRDREAKRGTGGEGRRNVEKGGVGRPAPQRENGVARANGSSYSSDVPGDKPLCQLLAPPRRFCDLSGRAGFARLEPRTDGAQSPLAPKVPATQPLRSILPAPDLTLSHRFPLRYSPAPGRMSDCASGFPFFLAWFLA